MNKDEVANPACPEQSRREPAEGTVLFIPNAVEGSEADPPAETWRAGGEAISQLKTLLETEQRARATAEAEVARREAIIAEINVVASGAKQSLANAVATYKALVIQANPGIPGELISGDTFEAINHSLESARTLISKVRLSIEAEIASGKVPAGAPARTTPDLGSLSPREKIQLALAKRQG